MVATMLASCTWPGDRHGPAELDELPGDRRTVLKDVEVFRETGHVGQRGSHGERFAFSSRSRDHSKVLAHDLSADREARLGTRCVP